MVTHETSCFLVFKPKFRNAQFTCTYNRFPGVENTKTILNQNVKEGAEPHLQFPPEATLAAADTVHDLGDVFEVEAKLLLRVTETLSCHHPLCPLTKANPGTPPVDPAHCRKLLFSPLASLPPVCAQQTWTSHQSALGTP